MPISFRLGLLTVAGLAMLAGPAVAQFGWNPPRPPGQVPNRGAAPPPAAAPAQPPVNLQDAMPPEEVDDDIAPPPVRPQATARGAVRGPQPPPGAVSSQPLAPPPGATLSAPGTGPNVPAPGADASAAPGAGQLKPPQPTSTAPQPGDEVVVEMPAIKITNPIAVFAGLDKITGRIIAFEVPINEKTQFGALQVTPRVCYTRPSTEAANTDGFIDVDEITLQGETKRIFTGWMFAASPGLHAVEHPIYDVWLTNCKGGATAMADPQPAAAVPPAQGGRGQQGNAGQGRAPATAGAAPAGAAPAGAAPGQPRPPSQRTQQQSTQQQPAQQQPVAQAPAAPRPVPPPPGSNPVQWPPRQ
jgi:hypothetical protein